MYLFETFCKNKNIQLEKYFKFFYFFFVAGFFILSTRTLRNYYYFFVIIPFLLLVSAEYFKILFRSKVFSFSIVYCLYMAFSVLWAADVGTLHAITYARKTLIALSFLTLTIYVFEREWLRVDLLYKSMCYVAGVMSLVSIYVFYVVSPQYLQGFGDRLVGIGNLDFPITAGNCYAAIVLISYSYFFSSEDTNIRSRFIHFFVILSAVTFIILTKSRGPILALGAVMVFHAVITRPKGILWIGSFFSLAFCMTVFSGLFQFSDLLLRGSSYRYEIWDQSLEMFIQKPWLGYGMGGKRPDIVYELGLAQHSHNLFISNMVDGGLVALLLLVLILSAAAYWAFRCFKEQRDSTLLCLVVFSVLGNLTEGRTILTSPDYQWIYFWLPVGLAAAYELRRARNAATAFEEQRPLPETNV